MASFWTDSNGNILVDSNGDPFWCADCPCDGAICPQFPRLLKVDISNIINNPGSWRCVAYTNPCNGAAPSPTDNLIQVFSPDELAILCGNDNYAVTNDAKYYVRPFSTYYDGVEFSLPMTSPSQPVTNPFSSAKYAAKVATVTYGVCSDFPTSETSDIGIDLRIDAPCSTPPDDYDIIISLNIGFWDGVSVIPSNGVFFSSWGGTITVPGGTPWEDILQGLTVDPTPATASDNFAANDFGDYSWDWSLFSGEGNNTGVPTDWGEYSLPYPITPPTPEGYGIAVISY